MDNGLNGGFLRDFLFLLDRWIDRQVQACGWIGRSGVCACVPSGVCHGVVWAWCAPWVCLARCVWVQGGGGMGTPSQ